jgi:flagellar basal body-associated protein FliL
MAPKKKNNTKKIIIIGLVLIVAVVGYMVSKGFKLAKAVIPRLKGYDKSQNRPTSLAVMRTHLEWTRANPNTQPERTKWAQAINYSPWVGWLQSKFV